MTTETMTIHKALAELKILDARIAKEIQIGSYCAANKHSNEKINGIPISDFEKAVQGTYDKVTDLLKRQEAIKRAVTLSNAKTVVNVSGKDYIVAEAIWMKNHGIEFKSLLINTMDRQYKQAQAEVNRQNGDDLEKRADQYVTAIYGQKEGKTNSADIEKVRKDFLEANSFEIIDPINVPEKLEALRKEVDSFMAEVDSALSVSNALTEITIEY